MGRTGRYALIAAAMTGMLLACGAGCSKKKRFVKVGTGGMQGVYYTVGGAIAKFVNAGQDDHNIDLAVQSTQGSVYNINAVMKGDLDFGIAQADRQYQAWNGIAEWKDRGPQEDLRSICSLHSEAITLVAADDAEIKTLADLKGKRVSIGAPGSGQRGNAIDVLSAVGLDIENDIKAEGLKPTDCGPKLQDGIIDAWFYTVGHPNGAVKQSTAGQNRKVRFVPITGMDALLKTSPFYSQTVVPKAAYPSAVNDGDVPTIGMLATLVTRASVPDEVVYEVTKAIFENFDAFKAQHPSLSLLTKEGMLKGLFAPLHPGAEKYYKEAGLLK